MDIVLKYLAAEDRDLAKHLAPPEILGKLNLPHHTGILAINGRNGMPVGLAICSNIRENRLDIEWLNVFERFRRKGIGEELILGCYETALGLGLPRIGVLMEGELATLENLETMQDYIGNYGFTIGIFCNGDWNITPADYDSSILAKKKIDIKNVIPAEQVNPEEIKTYLRKNWDAFQNEPLFDYEQVIDNYDSFFSMVYKSHGGIEGVLLVQFESKILYPLALDDSGEREITLALLAGVRKAVATEESRYSAHITRSEKSEKMMRTFFKNTEGVPAYLWVTNTDYYETHLLQNPVPPEKPFDPFAKNAPTNFSWLQTETFGEV